jgi:hypothetical protein
MGSPISPMEVIDIINKAITIYKKIKDQPAEIEKIGKRMPRLRDYLEELNELIDTKKHPSGLASLRPTQTKRLGELMKDVKEDVRQVYSLLSKWEKNEGPAGLVWRFDWVAHVVYTLGSSPDKLEALHDSIELHLNDINRFVVLLSAFAHSAALKSGVASPGRTESKNPKPARKPSPSPSPLPVIKKKNYNICFVDGFNIGRSRVSEAYLKLVREWTTRTGGNCPVRDIHSVGMNVKRADGCEKELQELKIKMVDVGKTLNYVAMDSLFDNKLFEYPYKNAVRTAVQRRTTTGISRDLFSKYDFIIVFTLAQQVKLFKLRDSLIKIDQSYRPHGKGKIVLLGDYFKPGTEIFEAQPETDRQKWNRVTSGLKLACKLFLTKELGWKQPLSST